MASAATADAPPAGRAAAPAIRDAACVVLALTGLALAVRAARLTDLAAMDDFGLASALPGTYWLGLALLSGAFALAMLREPVSEWLLALPAVALAIAVFGVVPIASDIPRDHVAFRHVGVLDHLVRTGTIDGSIDAYFNWPGFFVIGAFFGGAAGDPDLLPFVRWAPLAARLALMAPLLLLARTLLGDRRAAWVAVWVFMLWDWVDQDYFAPQTYDLFLYFVVLALAAGWLIVPRARAAVPLDHSRQRVGIYLVALVLCLAAVPSHQLTPVVIALILATLAVLRRLPQHGLPVVTALGVALWMVTGAQDYVAGHHLLSMPSLDALFGANVGQRVTGSEQHHLVILERMVLSAALWGLALLGAIRARRARAPVLVPAVLAVVPFLLLPLQEYGGEMLLRVHLFALPGMAILAVRLLAPPGGRRVGSSLAVLAVSLVVLPGLILARYGNDRLETFTPGEVSAVDALYAAVPPGGLLVSAAPYTPWRNHDYATYSYTTFVDLAEEAPTAGAFYSALLGALQGAGSGAVIITRTAYEGAQMLGSATDLALVEAALAADPRFELVHSTDDGRVYRYVSEEAGDG